MTRSFSSNFRFHRNPAEKPPRPPFAARTPFELSEQHQHERPPLLTLVRPDLPAELVRLVDRLLEKEAELRHENAALVRECSCVDGCPSCVGPIAGVEEAKVACLRLLSATASAA